jgi:hypothetical protein
VTPINPAKVSVIAVVYDNDDTSRTTTAGKTGNSADTPRAANSATPKSTAYDEENDPPKVINYGEKLNGNMAEVSATLEDEDGIGSAYVIYNFHNGSYDNESWGVMPMEIDGDNVATASIQFSEGNPVWYRILLVDGKHAFAASEAKQFEGTGSKVVEDSPGFGILSVTVALLIGLIRRRN